MKDLRSKVSVITGAGSGIGREVAIALAKKGSHLALGDISMKGLEETRELLRPMGVNVSLHQVDVSDMEQMKNFAQEVIDEHGHAHVLVNNAGVASGVTFQDQSLEDFHRVVDINLFGVVYGCKFFLPFLKKEDDAHIVNICSIIGLCGNPILGSYSASKFAVRGFSESLYIELKEDNVNVTTVYPGWTRTNLIAAANISDNVENLNSYRHFKEKLFSKGNSPQTVARRILYGIRKNKREVIAGLDTLVMGTLKNFIPSLALWIINRSYRS